MSLQKSKEQILNSIFTKSVLHFPFVIDSCPSTKQPIYGRYSALKTAVALLHPRPFLSSRSWEVLRIYWGVLIQSLDPVMLHSKKAWVAQKGRSHTWKHSTPQMIQAHIMGNINKISVAFWLKLMINKDHYILSGLTGGKCKTYQLSKLLNW